VTLLPNVVIFDCLGWALHHICCRCDDTTSRHTKLRHVPPTTTHLTSGIPLERLDAGTFAITRSSYGPSQRIASHTHDYASATVVLRGSLTERVASKRYELSPDRCLFRPADVVHENAYGSRGAECLIIAAEPGWVASDRVARTVFGATAMASGTVALMVARRIRRELRMGDDAAAVAIEGLALELVANASRQLGQPRGQSKPKWLDVVRERLHDEHAKPVRLHALARDAGVHPVYLARAFRQQFGCSPGEYLRQRRIDRASTELAETERSIAAIALDAGFSSPSHFATAFRAATGMSPRTYRRMSQSRFKS
jgi:AraC family transcriptional regulator